MKNGELVKIENLRLDPENPRLPDSVKRTEKEILKYIATETSIVELMGSIAEN